MYPKTPTFDVALKSTERQWVQKIPEVYTNDLNSVSIQFKITDCTDTELTGSTAIVLLKMRDGSFFQGPSVDVTRTLNVFSYTLKENEGNHDGLAEIQLIVTVDTKKFATQKYNFKVITGLDSEVAREIMIYDWSTLTAEARAYIDQFTADEVLRDAEFDNNQFDRNVAFNGAQGQRATDFGLAQTQRNTDFELAQTQRVNAFNAAEAARVLEFNNAEAARAAGYDADHSRAGTDHIGAVADRANAATDRTNAATDRTNAAADRTLAGTDHTTAAGDHTTALSDHAVLGGYNGRLTDVETDTSLDATNLVTNGDMTNGITGWFTGNSTLTVATNTLSVVGDGTGSSPRVSQILTGASGKKIYTRARVRVTNANATSIYLRTNDGILQSVQTAPVMNQWYSMWILGNFQTNTIRIDHNYPDLATANGKVMEVQYVSALDLTAIFGAGKEPTAAEMNRILARFPNSWFDGTKNLFAAKTAIEKQIALDSGAIMDATNLVTNGDFSNGTTGWSGTMITVTNGVARLLSDNTGGGMQQYPNTAQGTVKGNGGNKYYIRALVSEFTKVGYGVGFFQLGLSTTTPPFSSAGIKTYIVTPASAFNTLYVNHTVNAGSLIDYKIDNITLIDLTATFGAGNEPTLEQMDTIMAKFENSWFDGTKNLFQAKASLNKLMALDARTEFEIRNLVTNGDFSNGTTGWTGTIFTVSNNEARVVVDNTSGSVTAYPNMTNPSFKGKTGNKYYLKARISEYSKTGTGQAFFQLGLSNILPYIIGNGQQSVVVTASSDFKTLYINHFLSVGCVIDYKVSYIALIDLTETFGAGKEPTLAEMDRLMARFPNSWFDGVKPIQTIETLYQEKANKVQEDWITPSLLNGWTSISGSTVAYFKDTLGFVHLKGKAATGTINQDMFILPLGYRPEVSKQFLVPHGSATSCIRFWVSPLGELRVDAPYINTIDLSAITFKAEI